jgi:TM2 domain-containing membrane protein YozV
MMNQNLNNAGLAAVFSFIFNGLGQLYNGQILKGLVIIFLSAISMLVLIIGSILIGFWLSGRIIFGKELIFGLTLFLIGLVSICILGIYSILDAYRTAAKK